MAVAMAAAQAPAKRIIPSQGRGMGPLFRGWVLPTAGSAGSVRVLYVAIAEEEVALAGGIAELSRGKSAGEATLTKSSGRPGPAM